LSTARRLVWAHVVAVVLAAFSLVVLIPFPGLWSHLPGAYTSFSIAMVYAGPLHIVLGAAAMLAVGREAIGWTATWRFFVVSVLVSSGFELLGTGTGWPFGAYHYTSGLGFKLMERVPFSIPLSWFYASFSAWMLARAALARGWPQAPGWLGVLLGAWLLTAWDLVLDPAMSHPDLPVRFWIWDKPGQYLGMPLINLAGWIACGTCIVALGRWWGGVQPGREQVLVGDAFAVYAINLAFGAAVCAVHGFWLPVVLALVVGILPAAWGAGYGPSR
jgi:uncharacterized membrane protein